MRQKHRARIITRANQSDANGLGRRSAGSLLGGDWNSSFRLVIAFVMQDHAQIRFVRFAGDQLISLLRLVECEAMRDQTFDVDPAFGEQIEKAFEVASLSPAPAADRVI